MLDGAMIESIGFRHEIGRQVEYSTDFGLAIFIERPVIEDAVAAKQSLSGKRTLLLRVELQTGAGSLSMKSFVY